jgi:N-acetylglucosamine-6-phosphate deacetylase
VLTLDQGIRNMVRWAGVTPAAALQMATETPARLLGLTDRGRLVPGSIADLAIFDDPLRLTETFIAGQTVFRASPRTNTESG